MADKDAAWAAEGCLDIGLRTARMALGLPVEFAAFQAAHQQAIAALSAIINATRAQAKAEAMLKAEAVYTGHRQAYRKWLIDEAQRYRKKAEEMT